MAVLVINGITLDPYVALGSLRREPVIIGERRAAFGGGVRDDVIEVKERWAGRTIPVKEEILEGFSGLISGDALSLTFDDLYSAQGDPVAVAYDAATVAGGKYGTCLETESAPRWDVRNAIINGFREVPIYTYFGWRRELEGSAMNWFLYRPSGASVSWKNGSPVVYDVFQPARHDWVGLDGAGSMYFHSPVASTSAWTPSTAKSVGNRIRPTTYPTSPNGFRCTVAGTTGTTEPDWASVPLDGSITDGSVTWKNAGAGKHRVDDFIYVPYGMPDDWIPHIYSEHVKRSLAQDWHRLRVEGDFFGVKNLLNNPGFETGTRDWWTDGNVVAQSAFGSAYALGKYALEFPTANSAYQRESPSGPARWYPVVPGDVIEFGGWIYRPVGSDRFVRVGITIADANKANHDYAYTTGGADLPTPGLWSPTHVKYTVPTGKAFVSLYLEVTGGTTGSGRFDNLYLNINPKPKTMRGEVTGVKAIRTAGGPRFVAEFALEEE